ncbi:MAG: AMP-binding protein [Thermomicrobiales bacterium]
MAANAPVAISFGRRLGMLADEHPERAAIIFVPREGEERRVSWRELDRASNRLARLMAAQGVGERSTVIVGLPNCPEHFIASFATWKLGALVLALRSALPDRERDALLDLAQPALVIADWEGVAFPNLRHVELGADAYDDAPLPDRIPNPGKAVGSGGSTGRPKIIVTPGPFVGVPGAPQTLLAGIGFGLGQTQLVCAPLYHNAPLVTSYLGLFDGHTLVLMERFDAARAVELIERHHVEAMYLPPILMQRIAALPGVDARDFSSIRAVTSMGAPCPPWLKRFWINLVGARQVTELYAATEAVGVTIIRGDEWLAHPGSVGRPFASELRILDDAGRDLPPGEVGEVFMRRNPPIGETYRYLGAPPAKTTPDGFASVGDLGWVDEEGYLYIADRRVDMIVTGAANVYPAEVEAALTEHPAVADVAVIGVPDAEWGKRVHAIVELRAGIAPPGAPAFDRHCRERLASYKAPKTYEFVTDLPRNDAGKIQRSALAAARESGWTAGMIAAKAGQ